MWTPEILQKKYWELVELKNLVFELVILDFFSFFQKKKKFALSLWKSVNIYRVVRMIRNFDDFLGFQHKKNTCAQICNIFFVDWFLDSVHKYFLNQAWLDLSFF